MKMVTIKFPDDEYETYLRLARVEGRNFSRFVRDKLKAAVQSDLRETFLLERLVKLIENFSGFQPEPTSELQKETYKLLLFLTKAVLLQAEQVIVVAEKRKAFMNELDKLKRELGIDI